MKKVRASTTTYSMNDVETTKYDKFKKKHTEKCGHPCVGVTFIPTGIGIAVEVYCQSCGKTKDITDYNCW